MPDVAEILPEGQPRWMPLPDADRDGVLAPSDADDDGDRTNDGLVVDTDGDGVSNLLEMYGYVYDPVRGRFEPWNGDSKIAYFLTDPLQRSTDQDAYGDGAEVSGVLRDPTIASPGDDPLVPACPNLVCELLSYSVTLNEDVQLTETQTFSEGLSWNRQVDSQHTRSVKNLWEVGIELQYGSESYAQFHGQYGQEYENAYSTTTSVAQGGSITTESGWSVARSANPTRAAVIKLYMRLHNRGTAPVSNIVPTLSLKIGGLSVATFEPAGTNVNLLVPGARYPGAAGWLWVVDARATGGGSEPLYLTMSELRALERGAPISLSVSQAQGDSMQLSDEGAWESLGDTSEFTARCDAVCANVRIEFADGTLVQHLVYAGEGATAPPITLAAALAKLGVDADGTLHYVDQLGIPQHRDVSAYDFAIDAATLRANGWTLAGDDATGQIPTSVPTGFVPALLRLGPTSVVYVREPRPATEPPAPTIHFATLDDDTGEILVSADDCDGIAKVVAHNHYAPSDLSYREQVLSESLPGAGFFAGNARGPAGFESGDRITARVENLAGYVSTRALGELFVPQGPQKPRFTSAYLDPGNLRIYATVTSGNPDNPNSNVKEVKAYHPDFSGGWVELKPVVQAYKFPDKLEATLPPNFGVNHPQDVEIVPFVDDHLYTIHYLSIEPPVGVRRSSELEEILVHTNGNNNWLGVQTSADYTLQRLELDAAFPTAVVTDRVLAAQATPPAPDGSPFDVVMRMDFAGPHAWARAYFNAAYARVTLGGNTYHDLSRDDIWAMKDTIINHDPLRLGPTSEGDMLRPGDVLALITNQGRPAKLLIMGVEYGKNVLNDTYWAYVTFQYAVYDAPGP